MNAIEITLTCEPELDGPEGHFAMGTDERTCADCEGRGTILSPGGSYLTGGFCDTFAQWFHGETSSCVVCVRPMGECQTGETTQRLCNRSWGNLRRE